MGEWSPRYVMFRSPTKCLKQNTTGPRKTAGGKLIKEKKVLNMVFIASDKMAYYLLSLKFGGFDSKHLSCNITFESWNQKGEFWVFCTSALSAQPQIPLCRWMLWLNQWLFDFGSGSQTLKPLGKISSSHPYSAKSHQHSPKCEISPIQVK